MTGKKSKREPKRPPPTPMPTYGKPMKESEDWKMYADRLHDALGRLADQAEHFARTSFRILEILTRAAETPSGIAFRPFWEDHQAKVQKMVDALADVSPIHIQDRRGVRYSLQAGFIVGWIQETQGRIHAGLYLEICPHSVIV